jgi:hypothetical protein
MQSRIFAGMTDRNAVAMWGVAHVLIVLLSREIPGKRIRGWNAVQRPAAESIPSAAKAGLV